MITTGFESRVKIQQIIENQLPEFVISETPKAAEFLKQYYISQEFQGGVVDIVENLDQYKNLNMLTPEVISGTSTLTYSISENDTVIYTNSTKGFPPQYGLLKIDDEIITYTGIGETTFTGCKRGFSGIVDYHKKSNPEELEFSASKASTHSANTTIQNLSSLFLKEFYKKLKQSLAPGFEDVDFVSELNVNNFIKEIRTFYQSKGTEKSFKILYNVLYGLDPTIINLEDFLIKPSTAEFTRREVLVTELLSGSDPNNLVGQTIYNYNDTASAPVSEVEIIKRNNKNYYKIQLFSGYEEKSLIQGTFEITPTTKVIDTVNVGSTVITVDSTIGFDSFGQLICNGNIITYTDKSTNQFFGCTGIDTEITPGTSIRSDKIIYGYEKGDTTKKIELRVTGVLSDIENQNDIYFRSIGDIISVKNIGEKIENPVDKTKKELIFNSWIYNTSSRYEIKSFSNNQVVLYEFPDKSSLKVGDYANILDRNSENIIVSNTLVTSILDKTINLDKNITGISPNREISIRRNLKYASSSGIDLKYPKITANIQNTYDENSEYLYVSSNSLPDYNISKQITFESISITPTTVLDNVFSDFDETTQKYTVLSFENEVSFITGDAVIYTGSLNPINGLLFNEVYYVEVLEPKNKIRLYNARSFIGTNDYIQFDQSSSTAVHTFTLEQHANDKKLYPKKLLRKIPLDPNVQFGIGNETEPGPVGILVNGVEIINYKSYDKIYYGPLKNLKILNSGDDYDIINPPTAVVSNPSVSTGTTALIDLVIEGDLKEVVVDPSQVAVEKVISANITGGNGSGAVLKPIIEEIFNEISFNARRSTLGGGINIDDETISFLEVHNLNDGTPIVYDQNGNAPLGIGTFGQSNLSQEKNLINGAIYYPEIVNTSSIRLYNSLYELNTGINTIGFTTANTGGIHKFRFLDGKKILKEIKVLNSGSGYQNRSLKVNPTGISTYSSTVTFTNHGFNHGDLVEYRTSVGFGYTTAESISGLSTNNQYYIIKVDNSNFKVADAGVKTSTPLKDNFNRNKHVIFSSIGSGQQIFEYPQIKLNLEVQYSNDVGIITASPVLKGKIVDAYLYEPGTDYGSKILNLHRKPLVTIKNGVSAELKPIIFDGKIKSVEVQNGGYYYSSSPELVVNGNGIGAKLRAEVVDGRIVRVIVVNSGINYDPKNTTVYAKPSGKNGLLSIDVRDLTVNNLEKFSDEILSEEGDNLSYGIVGYSTIREGTSFSDFGQNHSQIIGWSYDGHPIYGPYGYSDPNDQNSQISLLKTGYSKSLINIENRPSEFDLGFFIEDYKYTNSGDLDQHNGRFSKTPDFPNGTYAYYVGVTTNILNNTLKPEFPYFIGNSYRSKFDTDLNNSQNFDFNSSKLTRNTFPYRINQDYSGNDFIIETNKIIKQSAIVESVSEGQVERLEILEPGDNYSVGDLLEFNNNDTGGNGASAFISAIKGKKISSISATNELYEDVLITRKNPNQVEVKINPYHSLLDGDIVKISGISTNSIKDLSGSHKIGVSSEYSSLVYEVPANVSLGLVDDIYVSPFPKNISIGSTARIGNEIISVLNVFEKENILRVSRGVSAAHTAGTRVNFYTDKFVIDLQTDYFDSKENNKIYFNPENSIGVGIETGAFNTIQYSLGNTTKSISIETQSIYLPNHPFKTNQRVLLVKPTLSSNSLVVKNTPSSTVFTIPESGTSQYVYIINKSPDTIGIVTQIGLTTSTNGLFFNSSPGDNDYYYIESDFNQVTGDISKTIGQVSVSTYHNLNYGDNIVLLVNPGLSTGIGSTSSSVSIKYNSSYNKILVNPVGFSSLGIDTSSSKINISNHSFNTGQKVFYDSKDLIASGLSTGSYFIHKLNQNYFYLCDTYEDSTSVPPRYVSIASTGGSLQELSFINPQLEVIKNNDVVFDLTNNSLATYNLKFFFDSSFKDEFISTGNTSNFSIIKTGIIGVTTDAFIKLKFDDSIPNTLYYTLEKSGSLISVDNEVKNASQILYKDSVYSGEYKIFNVTPSNFNITLKETPEKYNYNYSECDTIRYYTDSDTAKGGIEKINLVSGGFGYKKLPSISGVSTYSVGSNSIVKTKSTNIGKVEQIRILNEGFEYSSDKTLRPKANIPRLIRLQKANKITNVAVIFGGKNFISSPILTLINDNSRKKINSGLLEPNLVGNSISEVTIIDSPKGIESVNHTIFAEKNTNGVSVERILSYTDGVVECEISTPAISGFINPPFKVGDYVFVEGIKKQSITDELGVVTLPGTGFNSADNGYRFFRVVQFINSNPAVLKYDIGEFTENAGIPFTVQSNYFTSIVNKNNYPIFNITSVPSIFYIGEKLLVNGVLSDLIVESSDGNTLTITGDYEIVLGDVLTGESSGNVASVDEDINLSTSFEVSYSKETNYGWKNDIGKLNNNYQVLPDNDYYQNLSYSIKTSGENYKNNKVITFDIAKDSINRLAHPTGLKNFVDVGITSSVTIGISSNQALSQVLDFVSERRVDAVYNFDLALDYLPLESSSDAIILKSKKLANYIQCISNRVLQIDDISSRFSSSEFNRDTFIDAYEYSITDLYAKFLVQITDESNSSIQASELVILNNYDNTYTLNKADLYAGDELLGNLFGTFAENGNPALRFNPINPLIYSYRLKIYRDYFIPSSTNVGVGYTDIGFIRLSGKTEQCESIGITTTIFQAQLSSIDTIHSSVFVRNDDTLDMDYFEIFGYHDGVDSHVSEFYFNSQNSGPSFGSIGTFGITNDGGILKLDFTNNTNSNVTVKTKTIGFGQTDAGIGTYRYLVEGQIPETERSARLESSYKEIIGIGTITTYNLSQESTLKSLVRVGVGSTVAVHQLLVISDNSNVNLQQYPFFAVGTASTSGIGTFGVGTNGIKVFVNFYPDPEFSSDQILIQQFNQFLYLDVDEYNIPDDFTYGIVSEEIETAYYGSLNRFGKDRLEFDLNYNGTPIFEKTFNPNNTNTLNKSTGIFNIANHFFQTGEELVYTPSSTLTGVPPLPVGIETTLVGGKSFEGDFIEGFARITGISTTAGFNIGDLVNGTSVSAGTTIVSIGSTFTYFIGNIVGAGSTVISGIANTTLLSVGSSIFALDNTSAGSIVSIGINSITSSQSLSVGSGVTFYSNVLKPALTLSNVSTGTTIRETYVTGITTDIMPSTVYAIRIDNDKFKLTGTSGGSNVGFVFTSGGSGNYHKLTMKKNIEKCLITINGVNQYPILWTPVNHKLRYNGGSIGVGITYIALSGISSVFPRDLIKIDDEYVRVINVGLGTINTGPITGIGTIPLVQVNRGYVGSSATSHIDESEARIYRGSFNIVGNKIHFTAPPDGKGNNNRLDQSGLALPKSTFNGRVFLRRDYEFNKIYDDLSGDFTGIGRSFNLSVKGENTSGIEPGSGLVFINDVFQTPQTDTNPNSNYLLSSSDISGITTITFTSVTRPNTDDVIIVPYDVNQNQVPRGGLIVSLGSTGGLGYAPLVGASVTAIVGAGGSIVSVGIGTTDIVGSGYNHNVSIGVTEAGHTGSPANIRAIVGAGGTLSFQIIDGGTGYTKPTLKIDNPSYQNLSILGVSRLSVGNTTTTGIGLSITINVGDSSITGTGKSFFEVKSFNVTKPGYGFNRGDKFKVVGLVTDARLASPIEELIFTVEDTVNDSFACWQLGELDYIDSIKNLQNGSRKRFPLIKNNKLLSFEKDRTNIESNLIDFDAVLLIFINGVMQEPKVSYIFEGGTTFRFREAPKYEDDIAIFFYRGTRDTDSTEIKVFETVKPGDTLKLDKNDQIISTAPQENRIISLIQSADVVETGLYLGDGIDDENYRPIHWSKQKSDLIINEDYQYKTRDSLESIIVPTARVIRNISDTDVEIFVDDAQFFKYEENDPNTDTVISNFEGLLIDSKEPISAGFTANVSGLSTISSIGILTGGYGYPPNSTITLKIASPIGIGTIATATADVSDSGIVTSVTITNPGSGYTSSNPPKIICIVPAATKEFISEIKYVEGFSGIITGISTSTGTGSNPLAIKLNVSYNSTSNINSLVVGYPILITQTSVGNGVTSINSGNSDVVGIGTTFIDNIYVVNAISRNNLTGIITCNIHSSSNIAGISTNGSFCGRFSWGKLSGIKRGSNPVSIAITGYTVNSGLSTFPQILRRGYGLRNTGGLTKEIEI